MPIPIAQIDAFTDRPFAGNPAAVVILPEERDANWMQAVAREMNLSETAFLTPHPDGFNLRWFTPAVEVERPITPRSAPLQPGRAGPRFSAPRRLPPSTCGPAAPSSSPLWRTLTRPA